MLEKAKGLAADQVFLDLEDSVAPLAKADARKNIVAALNEGGYGNKIRTVRVNDWTTSWTYRDVVEVVENAGHNLDCIMLPKVQNAGHVEALDLVLTQIERTMGLPVGRIGIEAQIENALGLINTEPDVRLNASLVPTLPAREATRTPSDVFGALATANRQINLLLTMPFTPATFVNSRACAIQIGRAHV